MVVRLLGRTWPASRCDVDGAVVAEGNRLVGVFVRVVGEDLQMETQPSARRRSPAPLLKGNKVTHRVPPGLQQGQFPGSAEDRMGGKGISEQAVDEWREGAEQRDSTYRDSSSLLAQRLSMELSLSRTMMRFSRGLFSGGVISAARTGHTRITACL